MKKILLVIIMLIAFSVISYATETRRILEIQQNIDTDGRLTSVAIYYEDCVELIQFVYGENGEMYEILPHSGMGSYTEENGATFPHD